MTLVSLTDCCHLMAIDPKTLRRWMSLACLQAQPSPLDARCKCLTDEQVQQLATTHHRTLLDRAGTHSQQEVPASAPPTVVSVPVLPDVPPEFSALISDLTKQLGSLQVSVAMLQHELTFFTDQRQKEQEWQTSEASHTEEKSLESSQEKSQGSSREKSLEPSQEKSLESSQEKSQRSPKKKSLESPKEKSLESFREKESARGVPNTASIDRRKLPHVLPLVEYGAGGKYVVICPERGMLDFEPDSPEWFAWLSRLSSFRFIGQQGRFTANRGACLPTRGWRAARHIRNRSYNLSLSKTEALTIANLEQAAAALQSHLN